MSIGAIVSNRKPVISVGTDASVREIVALFYAHRIGAVLVMQERTILGLVSERDIAAGLHTHGSGILDARAGDIMTSPVLTVSPHESVAGAMAVMTNRRIRHLPVVESDTLIGLVSIGDLVKRRIEDAEQEALQLKDYIAMS